MLCWEIEGALLFLRKDRRATSNKDAAALLVPEELKEYLLVEHEGPFSLMNEPHHPLQETKAFFAQ